MTIIFPQPANTIRFNAASAGTANFVVASAFTGCTTPKNSGSITSKVYQYYSQSPDGTQNEFGAGAFNNTTNTLSRTTIINTSNNDQNIVNFTVAPIVDVFPSPSPYLETSQIGILYAYYSTSVTISTATYTIVPYDTIVKDTCSGFSVSTHQYTPNIPGDYFFTGGVYILGTGNGWNSLVSLFKNNSQLLIGTGAFNPVSGSSQGISQVSGVVSMNGTTDFIDIRGFSNFTPPTIGANTATNIFTGFLIH